MLLPVGTRARVPFLGLRQRCGAGEFRVDGARVFFFGVWVFEGVSSVSSLLGMVLLAVFLLG